MHVTFFGAARCVTGSCYLVEAAGEKFLVDCGMFQGKDDMGEANGRPLGFDPREIKAVILTHAHLDHCGRLPLLVKRGFRGPIISTAATRDLAHIVLMDAAHILEEHADHREKTGKVAGAPLYSLLDVFDTMRCFHEGAAIGAPVSLAPGAEAVFYEAGHILGSASVQITERGGATPTRVLFSGDLGPPGRAFLNPFAPPPDSDAVIMETTYGDRNHRSYDASAEELKGTIHDTFLRGGHVLIPTFALERTQELLFLFRKWEGEGFFPDDCQVFLDSPMAIRSTEVFSRYRDSFDPRLKALFDRGVDPFRFGRLTLSRSPDDSRRINRAHGRAIILSGSGMLAGGRMLFHLDREIDNPKSSLIFVGYQGQGTLGRELVDGARTVTIFGEKREVRIAISMINGFSAHADQSDLLAWCRKMRVPSRVILVHGEERSMEGFRKVLPRVGWGDPLIPEIGRRLSLEPESR